MVQRAHDADAARDIVRGIEMSRRYAGTSGSTAAATVLDRSGTLRRV
jgi:hypothetical protein